MTFSVKKKPQDTDLVEIRKQELKLQVQNQQDLIEVEQQILLQQRAINMAVIQAVGELVKSLSQR